MYMILHCFSKTKQLQTAAKKIAVTLIGPCQEGLVRGYTVEGNRITVLLKYYQAPVGMD